MTEELKTGEPIQVEGGTVEIVDKPPEPEAQPFEPQEMAAMLFTLYLPKFKQLVDKLPNRAIRRLLNALVETPLNDEPYQFQTEAEKNAFYIGDRLLQSKYIMIMDTFAKQIPTNTNEKENTNVTEQEIQT